MTAERSLHNEDIGFFDPEAEGTESIVSQGKYFCYRDVYAFVDRLKDMAATKGDDKVRDVLSTCFRGSAQIWHSMELIDIEKEYLRTARISRICEILITRFKTRGLVALAVLTSFYYGFKEAKAQKTSRSFAQDMFRYTKAAKMTLVYNQLLAVWNNLDLDF